MSNYSQFCSAVKDVLKKIQWHYIIFFQDVFKDVPYFFIFYFILFIFSSGYVHTNCKIVDSFNTYLDEESPRGIY